VVRCTADTGGAEEEEEEEEGLGRRRRSDEEEGRSIDGPLVATGTNCGETHTPCTGVLLASAKRKRLKFFRSRVCSM